MGFLTDTVLRQQITAGSLMTGLNIGKLKETVYGCSIDMHVGQIFRPGIESPKRGSATMPIETSIVLNEGETVVLQTAEAFKLDPNHAAFAFPASSVSIQGLLMTNPGHIDPGYVGPLHVTVINMGNEPFSIRRGDRFLRAFIYQFEISVESPRTCGPSTAIDQSTLDNLSPDFMSVNKRTAEAAKMQVDKAVRTGHIMQFVIPAFFSIIAAGVTGYLTNNSLKERFEERVKALEDTKAVYRINALELNYPTERRLIAIEDQLKKIVPRASPKKTTN